MIQMMKKAVLVMCNVSSLRQTISSVPLCIVSMLWVSLEETEGDARILIDEGDIVLYK